MGLFSDTCPECGNKVSKKARFCSKCGHGAPQGWVTCPSCRQWVGNDSRYCPHCNHPLHPEERVDLAGGVWDRKPGAFAQRIELSDVTGIAKSGLKIQEGTLAILLDAGKKASILGPGMHKPEGTLRNINWFGSPPPRSVVMVDAGDCVFRMDFKGMRTAEELPIDVVAEVTLRFDPGEADGFLANVMKEERVISAEPICAWLVAEATAAVKDLCLQSTVEDLVKDPERRPRFEDAIGRALKALLKRSGLELVRVGYVDFISADYEKMRIDYDTHSSDVAYVMDYYGRTVENALPGAHYAGETRDNYFNILPKISLTWHSARGYSLYANVASGYRSGGYNIQMFSDIVSASFRQSSTNFTDEEIFNAIAYKPEHCINYEIGGHIYPNHHLRIDAAAFVTNTTDQQVAQFVESGLGRQIANAGKSRSIGAEFSLIANMLTNRINIGLNYGFTNARFTDYTTYENGENLCFDDNRVPFVPEQTFAANVDGKIVDNKDFIINIGLNVNATGKTYWEEDNHSSQSAYAQLGAHADFTYKLLNISLWGRNITDKQADTFYFESLNHRFAQSCKPRHFGIDLRVDF